MTELEKLIIAKNYFPDATIELNYTTGFQLLVAVMLSAQTTDIIVNRATEKLFSKYKEAEDFLDLSYEKLYQHLKIIGLAKTKTNNLMKLTKIIYSDYSGIIPNTREELILLPGVGQKTANVVLANLYNQNYIAIDTHIHRICKRLNIIDSKTNVQDTEMKLIKILKNENLKQYHHSLIFFGRYLCKAKKPECEKCNLKLFCNYYLQSNEKVKLEKK